MKQRLFGTLPSFVVLNLPGRLLATVLEQSQSWLKSVQFISTLVYGLYLSSRHGTSLDTLAPRQAETLSRTEMEHCQRKIKRLMISVESENLAKSHDSILFIL